MYKIQNGILILIAVLLFHNCTQFDRDFEVIQEGIDDLKYHDADQIEIRTIDGFKFAKLKSEKDFRFVVNHKNGTGKGFLIFGFSNIRDYRKCAPFLDSILQRGYFIERVHKESDSCFVQTMNQEYHMDTFIGRKVW